MLAVTWLTTLRNTLTYTFRTCREQRSKIQVTKKREKLVKSFIIVLHKSLWKFSWKEESIATAPKPNYIKVLLEVLLFHKWICNT